MYGFEYFNELQMIQESLDSPVDFYMTDDTQIPTRIYGVFSIDKDQYGMSLELSDHDGIYLLSMYRILAKKPRKWSFKKPGHVRPGLSTLLKFVEACVPFIKSKMKGVICQVSGKNVDRYIRFAERLLKRTYITSFRVLPTKKSPDYKTYNWENIFFTRIGVNPKSVFSDSKFKKYDFDGETLSVEVSAEIKPRRPEKKTLKTEPSRKYSFGDLEIEQITIDSDIFDQITKVQKKVTTKDKEKKETELDSENLTPDNRKLIKGLKTDGAKKKVKKFYSLVNEDPSVLLAGLAADLIEIDDSISIDDYDQMQLAMSTILDSSSNEHTSAYLRKMKIIDDSNWPEVVSKEHLQKAIQTVKQKDLNKSKIKSILNTIKQFEKALSNAPLLYKDLNKKSIPMSSTSNHEIFETNLSPDSLKADMPGMGSIDYLDDFHGMKYSGKVKKDYNVSQSIDYIQNSLGYKKAIKNHKYRELSIDYTGAKFIDINGSMRYAFNDFSQDIQSPPEIKNPIVDGDPAKLQSMIYDMKPLENSMWVYRGSDLPEEIQKSIIEGDDFVDPAFLSTTIDPSYHFDGEHIFRIFLPKGTHVLPILDQSKHSDEDEIILPAMSVLKIIRVDKYRDPFVGLNLFITCIFVGSVFDDFINKFKQLNESNKQFFMFKGKKKKEEYDPKDKFSSNIDPEQLKAAQKFAKNAKKR